MAASATAVWEVRTGGANTNGGFYDSAVAGAGTDYSLQDAAQLAITDAVANGTTTITSATGSFTSAMVGNGAYMTGGTGTLANSRWTITTYVDANTVTVDSIVPTGTGITMNVGGALSFLNDIRLDTNFSGTASMSGTAVLTVSAVTYGTLQLGSLVVGTGFSTNTYVVAQLTGTSGGVGTYTVTSIQTVSSTAVTATSSASGGQVMYVKAGTYTKTSSTTIAYPSQGSNYFKIVGYDTDRSPNNVDTPPVITSATNSVDLITFIKSDNIKFVNLKFTHTAATRGRAFVNNTTKTTLATFERCVFDGLSSVISTAASSAGTLDVFFFRCEMKNCTGAAIAASSVAITVFTLLCYIHDNVGGVSLGNATHFLIMFRDVVANNSGVGLHLTGTSNAAVLNLRNCVFYKNTTANIKIDTTTTYAISAFSGMHHIYNNIIYGSTDGIVGTSANPFLGFCFNTKNAFGGQSGSARVNFNAGVDDITLTADPFVDGANHNFALNDVAGGGGLLKGVAFPQVIDGLSLSVNSRDIGVAQSGWNNETRVSFG